MTDRRPATARAAALLLALLTGVVAVAQKLPETFGEEVVVRETSVVALPPGGSAPPAAEAVTVSVGGLAQRVTRVEPVLEGKRGDWRMVVYLDSRLAGARTRFLASLALAQRAESLAAMGTVEVLVAEAVRPALARTDSWQRIEAALLSHALETKHRLARGAPATERPGWDLFRGRMDLLLETLEGRGVGGPRALFLPTDGLFSMVGSEELARVARTLAGSGWVLVPMPWSEAADDTSAARLSEFESWREGAEGRDGSAGTRRHVIDLGRVVRHLRGASDSPRAASDELEPQLVGLETLAGPTSGLLAGREAELRAALSNLARRWRVWFQTAEAEDGEPRPLEV
ncbi:MAG: hypothetical protein ACE5EG_04445, partial [Thermoanaerobaculia bacterium]